MGQHGVQSAGLQFILRIPNNRHSVAKVQRPVASLTAFGHEFNLETTMPSNSSDPAPEPVASHGEI
jgi:hypothetical protein